MRRSVRLWLVVGAVVFAVFGVLVSRHAANTLDVQIPGQAQLAKLAPVDFAEETATAPAASVHEPPPQVIEVWPTKAAERANMLDKKLDMSVKLLQSYMVKYHKVAEDYFKTTFRARRLAGLPVFPQRKTKVDVAILTPYEGAPTRLSRVSQYTMARYAAAHGYTFILDDTAYAANHTLHPTWNRVPSLQAHLPHHEWVFYLDSDIAIANLSILLEDFILRFPPDTYIAFTDGIRDFNAGAFFIRNVPWSYWLLAQWWKGADPRAAHRRCDALRAPKPFQYTRCMFGWNDQVALWDVLLPYYKAQSHSAIKLCATSPSHDWERSMRCYSESMAAMGYPYKKRSAFHVYFWPLKNWPRGFTFFHLERKTLGTWTSEELFHPGDFVIHTHAINAIRDFSAGRLLRWMEDEGWDPTQPAATPQPPAH